MLLRPWEAGDSTAEYEGEYVSLRLDMEKGACPHSSLATLLKRSPGAAMRPTSATSAPASVGPDDAGSFVVIDIETGAYEMDRPEVAASDRLLARHPDAQVWLRRIGSRYAHRLTAGPASVSGRAGLYRCACSDRMADKMSDMVRVTVDEIQKNLAGYLRRVEDGETLVVVRADKPFAEIKPVGSGSRAPRPAGLCAREFVVPDDFDEPLPEDVLSRFEGA